MATEVWIVLAAMGLALALRPWRALPDQGPPWPWLAWWAAMPLLWGADQFAHMPLLQPLSGACLLVLLAGWPLAMLAMLPVAAITVTLGSLTWHDGLLHLVWLGIVPGTLTLLLGAAIRRWVAHHLFVYILGRGFFSTVLAMAGAGMLALLLHGAPVGTSDQDLLIGRWLAAWGDGFMTGMFVAIFVAFRPQWLATYSDLLYLPRPEA